MKKTLTTLTLITAIIASIFAGTLTTSAAETKSSKATITLKVYTHFADDFYAENAENTVSVFWNNIKGASKYYLQMRKSTEKKYTTINSSKPRDTEYGSISRIAPTEAGKYYYRIVAKVNGKNIASNRVQITVPKKTATITETTPKTKQDEELITAETSTKTIDTEAMAKEVFDLVNVERTKAGLSQVVWDEELYECATIRAKELSIKFSHERPVEPKVNKTWVKNAAGQDGYYNAPSVADELGYKYVWIMENAAAGHRTSEYVVSAWMDSTGHRANILKSSHTRCAVGCYIDSDGYPNWALWLDSTP